MKPTNKNSAATQAVANGDPGCGRSSSGDWFGSENLTMKLQPCPFCGSKKTNLAYGSYTVEGSLIKTTNIICGNCNAVGPDTLLGEDVAAKKWNRRRLVRRRSQNAEGGHGQLLDVLFAAYEFLPHGSIRERADRLLAPYEVSSPNTKVSRGE